MTTRAINGVYNRSSIGGQVREADPNFYPLLNALRRLQLSGAVSLRLEKHGKEETGILILSPGRTPEVANDLRLVRDILKIRPGPNGELTLIFGALPRTPRRSRCSRARCSASCSKSPTASTSPAPMSRPGAQPHPLPS